MNESCEANSLSPSRRLFTKPVPHMLTASRGAPPPCVLRKVPTGLKTKNLQIIFSFHFLEIFCWVRYTKKNVVAL